MSTRWRRQLAFHLYLWRRRLTNPRPAARPYRRPVNRQLPYQRPIPHRPYRFELDLNDYGGGCGRNG